MRGHWNIYRYTIYVQERGRAFFHPRRYCSREDIMIAVRLVRLIENHSDELADGLLNKCRTSSRTSDLRNVRLNNCGAVSLEIIEHLSEWLISTSESESNAVSEKWISPAPPRTFLLPISAGLWY
jgi:hypothetical protein